MPTKLKDGETILFIGDSITDCGRRDDRGRPLGLGYVSMVDNMLTVREPEKTITVINTGIGGNTAEDLRSRWTDDALSHKPDWISIKIGINDCNRFLCHEHELQSPKAYAEILDEILTLTRRELPDCKLLLIDPFFGSQDFQENSYRGKVNRLLPEYIDAVHAMSEKYKTRLVKTHELLHQQFQHQHPGVYFPNEPVHPNQAGQYFIAEAVYEALSE